MYNRRVLALVIAFLSGSSSLASSTAALHWARTDPFGTAGGQAIGTCIDVTADGDVYVAGTVNGDYDFGGGVLPPIGSFYSDLFIAKYSASGEHLWSKRYAATGFETAIADMSAGPWGVYFTGAFQGNLSFGGPTLTSAGSYDIFVARLGTTGTHFWSGRFGNSVGQDATSIVVDNQVNWYLTGHFAGTINFGGVNLVSAGGNDIYLVSMNQYGSHRWSQGFGTANEYEQVHDLCIGQNANIAIVGKLDDPMSFGGPVLPGGAGFASPYIAKYNTNGGHQWSQSYPAEWSTVAHAVDFDMSGNVVFAGHNQQGPIDFGGGPLLSGFFLVKLSAQGVHQWSKRFVTVGLGYANSLTVDAADHIFLGGLFEPTGLDLGGGPLSNKFFVGRFRPDGSHYWSTSLDDASAANSLHFGAADDAGNIVLTNWYSGYPGQSVLGNPNYDESIVVKLGAHPAEPAIDEIADVGNDQGRQVRITFRPSGADATSAAVPIVQYEAFRRIDPLPSNTGTPLVTPPGNWEFVGAVPAHGEEAYQMIAATLADSTIAEGAYNSTFFIRAATANPGVFFDSEIGSGYSLDNLAPGVPLNFVYEAGGLSWDESSAPDFDFFTVYGSNTDSFGAAVVVDYSVAPAMDVSGSPYVYYFVTATDFSGNEGQPAKINTLSGAGGTPTSYVLSISNYPNPFNPRTTVSYTVPSRGAVTIEVYDATGARVATLLDRVDRTRGAYSLEWDGRSANGTIAGSGIYFARIEHPSGVKTKKMVLLK